MSIYGLYHRVSQPGAEFACICATLATLLISPLSRPSITNSTSQRVRFLQRSRVSTCQWYILRSYCCYWNKMTVTSFFFRYPSSTLPEAVQALTRTLYFQPNWRFCTNAKCYQIISIRKYQCKPLRSEEHATSHRSPNLTVCDESLLARGNPASRTPPVSHISTSSRSHYHSRSLLSRLWNKVWRWACQLIRALTRWSSLVISCAVYLASRIQSAVTSTLL